MSDEAVTNEIEAIESGHMNMSAEEFLHCWPALTASLARIVARMTPKQLETQMHAAMDLDTIELLDGTAWNHVCAVRELIVNLIAPKAQPDPAQFEEWQLALQQRRLAGAGHLGPFGRRERRIERLDASGQRDAERDALGVSAARTPWPIKGQSPDQIDAELRQRMNVLVSAYAHCSEQAIAKAWFPGVAELMTLPEELLASKLYLLCDELRVAYAYQRRELLAKIFAKWAQPEFVVGHPKDQQRMAVRLQEVHMRALLSHMNQADREKALEAACDPRLLDPPKQGPRRRSIMRRLACLFDRMNNLEWTAARERLQTMMQNLCDQEADTRSAIGASAGQLVARTPEQYALADMIVLYTQALRSSAARRGLITRATDAKAARRPPVPQSPRPTPVGAIAKPDAMPTLRLPEPQDLSPIRQGTLLRPPTKIVRRPPRPAPAGAAQPGHPSAGSGIVCGVIRQRCGPPQQFA